MSHVYTPEQLAALDVDELDRILVALNDYAATRQAELNGVLAQKELVRRARDRKLRKDLPPDFEHERAMGRA